MAMVVSLIAWGGELSAVPTIRGLSNLPALAIFVSALLVRLPPSGDVEVPRPTGAARRPRISQRARHDIAYVAFTILGLIAIWTSYWVHVDPDPGVIGFLVLIPFGIPLLLALILGPVLSVLLWRDVRLMTLTVLSIAMLAALSVLDEAAWPIPLSLYAAVCLTTGLVWFVKHRRRFG
jgi:hypothetical protein